MDTNEIETPKSNNKIQPDDLPAGDANEDVLEGYGQAFGMDAPENMQKPDPVDGQENLPADEAPPAVYYDPDDLAELAEASQLDPDAGLSAALMRAMGVESLESHELEEAESLEPRKSETAAEIPEEAAPPADIPIENLDAGAEAETGPRKADAPWFGELSGFQPDESQAQAPAAPLEEPEVLYSTSALTIPPSEIPPGLPRIEPESGLEPVTESDRDATTLTPVAFTPSGEARQDTQPFLTSSATEKTQPNLVGAVSSNPPPPAGKAKVRGRGCQRIFIAAVIITGLIAMAVVGFALYKYLQIARQLPDVDQLRARASQFETTRILDRNGGLLYEIVDPNAGKRTYVPLERMSPYIIAATIATEDKEYYNHPGFDLVALARALYANYRSGGIVSGASTITQQLARMILLPEERFVQSYERKASEIILAAEITRRYTKEEVLELYLNEVFYGNLSYGIEAASETYFDTRAQDLNLWQSAFLAGLPQSPAIYNIYTNRDATMARTKTVLVLMYELSTEKNCIDIGEGLEKVCVDPVRALAAMEDLAAYEFTPKLFEMRYPHWVVFIQSLLEAQFEPETIYRSGFTVQTTLDPAIQDMAQAAVSDQLAQMTGKNATNGAVVVMEPQSREVLAMVGSADFNNAAISGQVNMALTDTRQPGSAIKPLTYVAAFEQNWTPASLIWDVPSSFTPSGKADDPGPIYEPVNYDGRFRGPVTVRDSLANSYNIPAVKALSYIGIYDEPGGFIPFARRLGITSLNRPDYGLSLTLGGGEVSLMQLTNAFAVFADQGRYKIPIAITRIVDHTGKEIWANQPEAGAQVVRPAHAYLISDIMADRNARAPMFGVNSVLNLPFEAAVKTGTTNDFRDNWTVGYTPDLVVGVWVGNADYSPMVNTTGVDGAAPIWAKVMTDGIRLTRGGQASSFAKPDDVITRTICAVSGTEPSEFCPAQRQEIFASDQGPLPANEDLWVRMPIDGWTGLGASPDCAEFTTDHVVLNVKDPDAKRWIENTEAGQNWAARNGFGDQLIFIPERACRADDPRPVINMVNINNGGVIRENLFKIMGSVTATAHFQDYRIEWGEGNDPQEWHLLFDYRSNPAETPQELFEWDMREIDASVITFKVVLRSTIDTRVEKTYTMSVDLPTPTPTPTPTATPTLEPTPLPTATPTIPPLPTDTPVPSPIPEEPTPTLETPIIG